jgi:hypothetical protein
MHSVWKLVQKRASITSTSTTVKARNQNKHTSDGDDKQTEKQSHQLQTGHSKTGNTGVSSL